MVVYTDGQRDAMILEAYPYVRGVARVMSRTFPVRGINIEDFRSVANEKVVHCAGMYRGDPEKFKYNVMRAVRNAIYDLKRKEGRENTISLDEAIEDGESDVVDRRMPNPARQVECREKLERARKLMGEGNFLMFKLLSEGYDYEEISQMLSIAYGTVCSRISRVREKLKK